MWVQLAMAQSTGRRMVIFLGLAAILFASVVEGAVTMQAVFSMNEVKGHVELTQVAQGQATTIAFSLAGVASDTQVFVKTFPVVWDSSDRCSDAALGATVHDLSSAGTLTSSNQNSLTFTSSTLDLQGANSVQGRSLLFVNTQGRSCATIESTSLTKPTAMVRLTGPIGGTIFFREAGQDTTIVSNLYFTDGTSVDASDYTWAVKTGKTTKSTTPSTACGSLGSVITNGDLTTVHGTISVAARVGTARKFFLDTTLEVSALTGNSVEVSLNGKMACGDITKFEHRSAVATFDMDGVKGDISFMQASPFDPVEVTRSLTNLRSLAKGYHIHEYPVPPKLSKDDNVCSGQSVGNHLNPFNFDPSSSPSAGTGTDDQYEVGDLSGKYGTLEGLDDINLSSKNDWNMMMFMGNSILGRSVVIHKVDGSRWVCANIGYPYSDLKTAVVTFKYPVIGQIWLHQNKDDPLGETAVYATLGHSAGSATTTTNHNFHVHVNKVGDDMDSDTTRCKSVAGHYNPFAVSVESPYSTDCSPLYPDRCELGDNSNKGGTLDIGDASGNWKRKFYTDVNLPLSGPFSVIGRSITIHAENKGAARLACADIVEYHPKYAVVKGWSSDIGGTIYLKQPDPFHWTNIKVNFTNLAALAGPYHVHVKSIPQNVAAPCSGGSVGGHFNPFDVTNSPPPGNGTVDQYEVGDLSGKFGKVTGAQTFQDRFYDQNLPLHGQQSILGRSVVVHKDADGSRWACANISLNSSLMAPGKMYRASMKINNGEVDGYIRMSQYVFDDGSMSDTSVEVDVKYTADSTKQTSNHKWHVHEKPVSGDGLSSSNPRCKSAKGHYNPFHADVTGSYTTDCGITNPLRCELGDLSGKHKLKISIGGGRYLATDVDLPLTGKYSVVGRSIVIHEKDSGAPRFACADILPDDAETVKLVFPKTDNYSKSLVVSQIASALSTDTWNIVVAASTSDVIDSDCIEVVVYLSGPSKSLKGSLETMIKDEDSRLGNFKPSRVCGDGKDSGSAAIHHIPILVVVLAVLTCVFT